MADFGSSSPKTTPTQPPDTQDTHGCPNQCSEGQEFGFVQTPQPNTSGDTSTTSPSSSASSPSADNDHQPLVHGRPPEDSISPADDHTALGGAMDASDAGEVLLSVRWGTQLIALTFTPTDFETFSVLDLRRKIEEELNVPQDRQKFLGLAPRDRRSLMDCDMLAAVEFKKPGSFVLVGTTREKAFIDPSMRNDLPEVIDDFIYDDNPSNRFYIRNDTHLLRLRKVISSTEMRLIRQPRPQKGLLVLDLDYTLLDCKGGGLSIDELKRPHLDSFLHVVSQHFDLGVWSQTQWKWVEMKCTELGLLTSSAYGICFALDRSSMFTVCARQKDGTQRSHEVKALEIIWTKFPDRWGPHNTIHVDDLARNFAFNPRNGVKVSSYRRCKGQNDNELLPLASYLTWLSTLSDISAVDHIHWKKRVERGNLVPGQMT